MSPSKTSTLRAAAAALAIGTCALTTVAAAPATAAPLPASGTVANAGGCAQNCIRSAIITPTISTAEIAVQTHAPATIAVQVRQPSTDNRPGPLVISALSSPAQMSFTAIAEALQPDRTYSVTVTTKDAGGVTQRRTGTFHTLKAVPLLPPTEAGGTLAPADPGCSAECITGSSATANLTTAALTVKTRVPASLVVQASRTAPVAGPDGLRFTAPEKTVHAPRGTVWNGSLTKLKEKSKYFVLVKAIDEQGRHVTRQGTFKTLQRNVQVRFTDIRVTNDADKGVGRGEISFFAEVNGEWVLTRNEDKIASDSTVHFANGGKVNLGNVPRTLDFRVQGTERDGGNLCFDARSWLPGISGDRKFECGSYDWDTAVGTVDLGAEALAPGALPPGWGGGAMYKTRVKDAGRGSLNFNVGVEVDVWAS